MNETATDGKLLSQHHRSRVTSFPRQGVSGGVSRHSFTEARVVVDYKN